MRTEIHLDKDDIEKIVADKFCTSPDSVFVECFMDYEGYGTSEHQVPCVRAVVFEKGGEVG